MTQGINPTGLAPLPAAPAPDTPAVDRHRSPAELGKEFEGMFAALMIKQMRQSQGGAGLFGKDPGDVLGGLFDHFMSQHIAQRGSLGIGAMVRKQMERRSAP